MVETGNVCLTFYGNLHKQRGKMAQRVERWTCHQQVVGSNPTRGKICITTLGQVVYTYVPLSSSSITWYRPRGGDALWLGR